jgi:hypothetical protein
MASSSTTPARLPERPVETDARAPRPQKKTTRFAIKISGSIPS